MRKAVIVVAIALVVSLVVTVVSVVLLRDQAIDAAIDEISVTVQAPGELRVASSAPRTTDVYRGHGAWVDAFDYSPNYTDPDPPHLTPHVVDEMAAHGVTTLYLQATRLDERTPGLLEDRWLLTEFLLRAHQQGIRVVGWYLPKWTEDSGDIDRIRAVSDFEVLGHRFDGVGIDIEYIADDLEPEERSRRLVALSRAADTITGDGALAAIVPPPVQIEVINPRFWPGFPWCDIAPYYDVWMPMSYWSFRSTASGYKDGYRYTEESIRRLRNNVGDQDALVHAIGGIGAVDGIDDDPNPEEPLASINDLAPFVQALRETGAIGGSMYDWRTLEPPARTTFSELVGALGEP